MVFAKVAQNFNVLFLKITNFCSIVSHDWWFLQNFNVLFANFRNFFYLAFFKGILNSAWLIQSLVTWNFGLSYSVYTYLNSSSLSKKIGVFEPWPRPPKQQSSNDGFWFLTTLSQTNQKITLHKYQNFGPQKCRFYSQKYQKCYLSMSDSGFTFQTTSSLH